MRSSIAYYLLILYTLALCKPVLPLVQDALGHFFNEAQHLATVHQHNGTHHVDNEVAAAEKEEKKNSNSTSRSSENLSFHIPTLIGFTFLHPKSAANYFGSRAYHTTPGISHCLYIPPKV